MPIPNAVLSIGTFVCCNLIFSSNSQSRSPKLTLPSLSPPSLSPFLFKGRFFYTRLTTILSHRYRRG